MDQAEIASFAYVPKVFVVCNQVDIASIWGYILRQKGISVIPETTIEKAIKRWYVEAADDSLPLDFHGHHSRVFHFQI